MIPVIGPAFFAIRTVGGGPERSDLLFFRFIQIQRGLAGDIPLDHAGRMCFVPAPDSIPSAL